MSRLTWREVPPSTADTADSAVGRAQKLLRRKGVQRICRRVLTPTAAATIVRWLLLLLLLLHPLLVLLLLMLLMLLLLLVLLVAQIVLLVLHVSGRLRRHRLPLPAEQDKQNKTILEFNFRSLQKRKTTNCQDRLGTNT